MPAVMPDHRRHFCLKPSKHVMSTQTALGSIDNLIYTGATGQATLPGVTNISGVLKIT
jgi:hypothetical protein